MKIELASWLGTYWVHSTLILGSVWLLLRVIPRRSHRLRESLWKTALLAGFLTATAQSVLPLISPKASPKATTAQSGFVAPSVTADAPLLTVQTVPTSHSHATESFGSTLDSDSGFGLAGIPGGSPQILYVPATAVPEAGAAAVDPTITNAPTPVTSPPSGTAAVAAQWLDTSTARSVWRIAPALLWWIALVWFAGALLGSARFLRARRQLFRQIDPRTELQSGELFEALRSLVSRASVRQTVRLTDSDRASSPMALHGSEICIPVASMSTLPEREQRAMLAHELGHIVRKDPLWLTLSHWIETLFFFQPLNRIARREIQREAEFLADDWALAHSTGGLVLARCLATVAEWVGNGRTKLATVSAMAEHDSSLVDRVQRLVDGDTGPSRSVPTWVRFMMVGVLCLVVVLIAPQVAARSKIEVSRNGSIVPDAIRGNETVDVRAFRAKEEALERYRYELERDRWEVEAGSRSAHDLRDELRELAREERNLKRGQRSQNLSQAESRRLEKQLHELERYVETLELEALDGQEPLFAARAALRKALGRTSHLLYTAREPHVPVAPEPSILWRRPDRAVFVAPTPPVAPSPRSALRAPLAPTPPGFPHIVFDGLLEPGLHLAPHGDGVTFEIPS